jgi:hypothetical protein
MQAAPKAPPASTLLHLGTLPSPHPHTRLMPQVQSHWSTSTATPDRKRIQPTI